MSEFEPVIYFGEGGEGIVVANSAEEEQSHNDNDALTRLGTPLEVGKLFVGIMTGESEAGEYAVILAGLARQWMLLKEDFGEDFV